MYHDCGGIQLQSFGLKANFELKDNNKLLQQTLLYLGLWFRVYIGSSYPSMGSGRRIIVILAEKKTGKMLKTRNFALIGVCQP